MQGILLNISAETARVCRFFRQVLCLLPINQDFTGNISCQRGRAEKLSAIVVALAQLPAAIAFSIIAGVAF
jgi:hypothetical protein